MPVRIHLLILQHGGDKRTPSSSSISTAQRPAKRARSTPGSNSKSGRKGPKPKLSDAQEAAAAAARMAARKSTPSALRAPHVSARQIDIDAGAGLGLGSRAGMRHGGELGQGPSTYGFTPGVSGGYGPTAALSASAGPGPGTTGRSITLQHIRLTLHNPQDPIGLALADGDVFPKVSGLPRVIFQGTDRPMQEAGSGNTGTAAGAGALHAGAGGDGDASRVVGKETKGAAERSKAIHVGDVVLGVGGVLIGSSGGLGIGSAAHAWQMILAARRATHDGSVVLHVSREVPPANSRIMAQNQMNEAAERLMGLVPLTRVKVAMQGALSRPPAGGGALRIAPSEAAGG